MSEMTPEEKLNYIIEQQAIAIQAVNEAKNKVYPQIDTRLVQVNLEQSYKDIIADYPALDGISAVGLKVLLNHGEVINRNGNRLFYLDGDTYVEVTADSLTSAASETQAETAIIWFFANNGSISVGTELNVPVLESYVKDGIPTFSKTAGQSNFIHSDYYDVPIFYNDGFYGVTLSANQILVFEDTEGFGSFAPKNKTKSIIFNSKRITTLPRDFITYLNIPKLVFPECEELNGSFMNPFVTAGGGNTTTCHLPKIIKIINTNTGYRIFRERMDVTIPDTCKTISGYVFGYMNGGKILLECIEATIDTNWCTSDGSYPTSFTLCDDWQATINISVAAHNWTSSQFNKLLGLNGETSLLHDFSGTEETRDLTLPISAYDSLTSAQITELSGRGWNILRGTV